MSVELDRIVHRREPVAAEVAARPGAERARTRAAGSLEPGREGDRPAAPRTADDDALDFATPGDADVRVTLSAAALRLDPNPTGDATSPGTSGPEALDAVGDESHALDEDRALDSSRAPRPGTGPRERVFDAYREPTPARRGERIRVVV